MSELLGCPFCGSPAEITKFTRDTRLQTEITQIQCVNDDRCHVSVDIQHTDEAAAIKAWNTRASPAIGETREELLDLAGWAREVPPALLSDNSPNAKHFERIAEILTALSTVTRPKRGL